MKVDRLTKAMILLCEWNASKLDATKVCVTLTNLYKKEFRRVWTIYHTNYAALEAFSVKKSRRLLAQLYDMSVQPPHRVEGGSP